jgi:hypothetical protein
MMCVVVLACAIYMETRLTVSTTKIEEHYTRYSKFMERKEAFNKKVAKFETEAGEPATETAIVEECL